MNGINLGIVFQQVHFVLFICYLPNIFIDLDQFDITGAKINHSTMLHTRKLTPRQWISFFKFVDNLFYSFLSFGPCPRRFASAIIKSNCNPIIIFFSILYANIRRNVLPTLSTRFEVLCTQFFFFVQNESEMGNE